jgi:hypothetical protein
MLCNLIDLYSYDLPKLVGKSYRKSLIRIEVSAEAHQTRILNLGSGGRGQLIIGFI